MPACKKCNEAASGNYCQHCGHPLQLKRVDARYLRDEIAQALSFEKGFLFSVKELFVRPGQSIREFLTQDRGRLVKPVIFIIITSLIYTLINGFFRFEESYTQHSDSSLNAAATTAIFSWVQEHYGYANILMGGLIALWIRLFFKRSPYNFFEILILLCFVMGVGMLIYAMFGVIGNLAKIDLVQVAGVASIVYCSWAVGQFFGSRKATAYLKAFAAYLLGMFTFTFFCLLLGSIIDLVRVSS
ncbi:DUF3667 domain-containing protein [Parapedobacter koreensis]|uniref:DUF3667 domain-containing protein n=1 Tax=Parapedobacter koreensis TaxID=332977 RepID=A0A1H7TWH9_9SPHI|nr:DUF3667 domain-containing protein [Parapedobacter koreensis]SEL89013.1 Protein of unknown function [Parapedobacter koreensis]